MGDRFRSKTSLKDVRELSRDVTKATEESFRSLLRTIVSRFEDIQNVLGYDTDEKRKKYPGKNGKKNIPLRSVIIGGDDITFVCDGKLGVYFARIFLEAFEKQQVSDNEALEALSACAGIAITKTKYPFHRGYELADDLCKNAKKRRKEKGGEGSWIDFHIAYGGFSGTLDEIRKSHYQSVQGKLVFGPYKIGDHPVYGFNTLIANIWKLKYKQYPKVKNFPNSKIKELRKVLTLGEEATRTFASEIEARGYELPEIPGNNYKIHLFENSMTPYFDMVELMEFYPEFALAESS